MASNYFKTQDDQATTLAFSGCQHEFEEKLPYILIINDDKEKVIYISKDGTETHDSLNPGESRLIHIGAQIPSVIEPISIYLKSDDLDADYRLVASKDKHTTTTPVADLELGAVEIKDAVTETRLKLASEGGQGKVMTQDMISRSILEEILIEIKLIKVHMQEITGDELLNLDVD